MDLMLEKPLKVCGYNNADPGVIQFALDAATGRAMAGGGTVILDDNGVTVLGQQVRFRDVGDTKTFGWVQGYDAAYGVESYEAVALVADAGKSALLKTDNMQIFLFEGDGVEGAAYYIYSDTNDIWIEGAAAGAHKEMHLLHMDLVPTVDEQVGTFGDPFAEMHADDYYGDDYYGKMHVEGTVIAGRPAAAPALDGTFWKTREGAGTKGFLWICMRNLLNFYEWVQVGITT